MSDHVEVTGSGSASATPDVVVLDARVNVDGKDVATALSSCADKVTKTLEAAKDHGIADPDRQSTGVGVHPRWDREGQTVIGYTAYQSFRLVVRDRGRVGDVLASLARAAGDSFGLDSVTLRVADTSALLTTARDLAFEDARIKAEQYAARAGRALGPVTRVTEVNADSAPAPRLAYAGKMMDGGAESMPIEGGESAVRAAVVVRFDLL